MSPEADAGFALADRRVAALFLAVALVGAGLVGYATLPDRRDSYYVLSVEETDPTDEAVAFEALPERTQSAFLAALNGTEKRLDSPPELPDRSNVVAYRDAHYRVVYAVADPGPGLMPRFLFTGVALLGLSALGGLAVGVGWAIDRGRRSGGVSDTE